VREDRWFYVDCVSVSALGQLGPTLGWGVAGTIFSIEIRLRREQPLFLWPPPLLFNIISIQCLYRFFSESVKKCCYTRMSVRVAAGCQQRRTGPEEMGQCHRRCCSTLLTSLSGSVRSCDGSTRLRARCYVHDEEPSPCPIFHDKFVGPEQVTMWFLGWSNLPGQNFDTLGNAR
jgi:hypothetical protein